MLVDAKIAKVRVSKDSAKTRRGVPARIQLQLFDSGFNGSITNSDRRCNCSSKHQQPYSRRRPTMFTDEFSDLASVLILIYDPSDKESLNRLRDKLKPNPAAAYNAPLGFTLLVGYSTSTPSRPRPSVIHVVQAKMWAIQNGVDLFLPDLSYARYFPSCRLGGHSSALINVKFSDGRNQDSPWRDKAHSDFVRYIFTKATDLVLASSICYAEDD
jgi:hypothetical protein